MARAVLVAALVLPLALAFVACSDSSKDSSTTQAPYAGAPTQPPAPAHVPLTQADVDKWATVTVAFAKKAPKNLADQTALLESHGLSQVEWGSLYQRVSEAKIALYASEKRQVPVPPHMVADVELIKANREKVEKATAGKE